MRITIDQLDRWSACCRQPSKRYDNKHLNKIFKGRNSIPKLEVLKLNQVRPIDKLWVMIQPGALTKR